MITPRGRIVWTYGPPSGARLARPAVARGSLAERHDRRHRRLAPPHRRHRPAHEANRLAVRPPRRRLVGPGLPLEAGRPRPAARAVRRRPHRCAVWSCDGSARCHGRRLASPSRPCRAAALLALGGLVGGSSTDRSWPGPPGSLRRVGTPADADARRRRSRARRSVYLFGGGEQVSSPRDRPRRPGDRPRPARGHARRAALRPRRRLRPADVAYLVGGYTGSRFATAILRYRPGGGPPTARRPASRRAALRGRGARSAGRIYVAGGVTTSGDEQRRVRGRPARRHGDAGSPRSPRPSPTRRSSRSAASSTSSAAATPPAARSPRSSASIPPAEPSRVPGSLPGPARRRRRDARRQSHRRPRRRRVRPRRAPSSSSGSTSLPAMHGAGRRRRRRRRRDGPRDRVGARTRGARAGRAGAVPGRPHAAARATARRGSSGSPTQEPEWVRLAQEALRLWRELEAETGEPVLDLTGLVDLPVDRGAPRRDARRLRHGVRAARPPTRSSAASA